MMRFSLLLALFATLLLSSCNPPADELPNILWITSEDNSPLLGCYGDDFATTPRLDKLAGEGFLYTKAYANAPVCAPTRNTILTGVHACSNGHEHMRSYYRKSELVRPYPEFLRAKGYYCTNNAKTDYNYAGYDVKEIWDECGNEAHYTGRAEGQPFFAVFNITISHESCLHKSIPDSLLRHRPEDAPLPPYHPATPEMKHDWAQYYDKVEDMDSRVGKILDELEASGLAENTIVFYYADHGGVLGRSKRYLYETGTHVPFIVRIPEKYKHYFPGEKPGSELERLVSFVDLAPTLLSLIGERAPDYMQGNAFLGQHTAKEPECIYMFRDRMDGRYDMSRSIVDGHYRYTRNFNANRIYGQHLIYLWRAPSMASWERAFLNGECNEVQSRFFRAKAPEELYDIENDPWEINNLANDPVHAPRLAEMRKLAMHKALSLKDAGFIPEANRNRRTAELACYDYMRQGEVPLEEIMKAAWTASLADPAGREQLLVWLRHDDSAIRYWAVQGLLLLGEEARQDMESIKKAAMDPDENVSVVAAELLWELGEKAMAVSSLKRVLTSGEVMARTHALNCIDCIEAGPELFLEACLGVLENYQVIERQYDARVISGLMKKWGIDPAAHEVVFTW